MTSNLKGGGLGVAPRVPGVPALEVADNQALSNTAWASKA